MADKMGKAKITEKKGKVENLIKEIEDLIKEKLGNKTLIKNYPFIEESESEPKPDSISIHSLPDALKNFGKEEEKNWIFYGPPGTGKTFALNKIIPTQRICINNTNETQGKIKELYTFLYTTLSTGFNKLFFEIINRFIGIPFNSNNIKTYLKCEKSKINKFPFVIGTEGLLDKEKGKEKSDDMADKLFKEDPDPNYEFKKESEDKSCLNIVPRLFEQDKNSDLINKIDFEQIKILLIEIVNLNLEEPNRKKYHDVTKIVFHPSYTYEDFVGGIKPDLEQTKSNEAPPPPTPLESNSPNSLTYKYTCGVMLDLIRKAWGNEGGRYYLIIDEFNRGNIAAIFGEFLYLIENDKRSKDKNSGDNYVFLPGGVYPWDDEKEVPPFSEVCKIRMPRNIFIVGALNTADRSIATMDFAMRRRFNFVKFEPNEELITGFSWITEKEITADSYLKILFVSLNTSIKYKLDADHEIGHYYFMPTPESVKKDTETFLKDLFERKIIPLLEAYCDHDDQAVNRILALTKKIMKKDCSKIVEKNIVFEILLSTQELKKMDREFNKDSKTENSINDFWNPKKIKNVLIKKLPMNNIDTGEAVSTPVNSSD